MLNKVGDKVPSRAEADALEQSLQKLLDRIGAFTIELTSKERKGLLRMRRGGQRLVAHMGTIAKKYDQKLPRVRPEDMLRDLELVQLLAPMEHLARRLAGILRDTKLQAEAETWGACLAFYAALREGGRGDAEVMNDLEPVAEFLARPSTGSDDEEGDDGVANSGSTPSAAPPTP